MKGIVNALASAVRRQPVLTIILSVAISVALGVYGVSFNEPGDGGNEAFAPDTPELVAAERIGDLYGEDSSQVPLQFLVTSASGDVITADGFAAMTQLGEFLATSPVADDLIEPTPQQQPLNTFLFPVDAAIGEGAPPPTDTAGVKTLFSDTLASLPPEQSFFIDFLYPSGADPTSASSDQAMAVAFLNGVAIDNGFDEFVDRQAEMAEALEAVDFSGDIEIAPFSFELIQATGDEFQAEIAGLFAQAFMIIMFVLVLVFWVGGFRSGLRRTLADMGLTMITIVLALMWVWGFWKLLYDSPNPMTQIIPILLIGLGVDYSIHLNTRYREEIANGEHVDAAIGLAIRTVGASLVLATATTAIGFLTNIVNPLPALQGFGVLSAVGILASFLLMLTFVPAVRTLLDRRGERRGTIPVGSFEGGEERILSKVIGRTSGLAKKIPVATLIAALVLGIFGAIGVTRLETTFSFLDFVPTSSPVRGTGEVLLNDFFAVGEQTQVLIEGDVTSPGAWNSMALAVNNAASVDDVVTLPGPNGLVAAADSPISLVAQLTNPDSPTYAPAVAEAAQAVELTPELAVTGNVTALYDAMMAAAPDQASSVLHRAAGGGYDSALVDFTTSAGEAGAAALAVGLGGTFDTVRNEGLAAIVTSQNIISDVIITSLRDSQVSSLAITLVVAMLLLMFVFWAEVRRPMLGVITALPVVLVVVWSLGIMAFLGIPFGPVTATISALAIGIGIPYTIHITRRYLEDRKRFATVEEAIDSTTANTGAALAGSAVTTVAGFGILMTSTTIPFQQFGAVTAYTILLSLIGAVLVLPSMLVLWDRWHRKNGDAPHSDASDVAA